MGGDEPASEVPDVPAAEVPDVVGFDAADACEMVRTAGLVPYGQGHADAPQSGVIMAQTPGAGRAATVGEGVFLQTDAGDLAPD
jgi:beta-lactam-binding protein with PASTA domain